MNRHAQLEEIPVRGDLIEVTIESTRDNHLGEKYVWVYEQSKVTRIIKNKIGKVLGIRLKGVLVKLIKFSEKKGCFYTTINNRRIKVDMEIINEE